MATSQPKTNADYFADDYQAIENPASRLSRLKQLEQRISFSLLPFVEQRKQTLKEGARSLGLAFGGALGMSAAATCISFFSVFITTLPVSISVTAVATVAFGLTGNAFGRLAGKGLGLLVEKFQKKIPVQKAEETEALQKQLSAVQNRIGEILAQEGENYQQTKSWRRLFKKHPSLKADFAKATEAKKAAAAAAERSNTVDTSNWRKLGL